ncbi:MAG: hypothetical protein OXE50_14235 [Chloroflexi bacterium]|nr:hypothetical protein [Chloroflexota bacterium]
MEVRPLTEREIAEARALSEGPVPKFLAREGRMTGYGMTKEEAIKNLEDGQRYMAARQRIN